MFSFIFIYTFLLMGAAGINPWKPINEMYIDPMHHQNIKNTLQSIKNGSLSANDRIIANMHQSMSSSSAYWLDKKTKIDSIKHILDDMTASSFKSISFIIYNLPNRDCKALASNGEICCNTKSECNQYCNSECQKSSVDCDAGLNEYKKNYIDKIYNIITDTKYNDLRKIFVIEPDSLPNCVTNLNAGGCTNTTCQAYIEGIEYAITVLSNVSNTFLYLDAGHGGWLGWNDNMMRFIKLIQKLSLEKIRGFATNTANYQPLGVACLWNSSTSYNDRIQQCKTSNHICCNDPCKLNTQYNLANNELNYVQLLSEASSEISFRTKDKRPRFVIDTGRNGNESARIGTDECKIWCNVNHAKIGKYPTTETPLPYIDAYAWLKTPGESDGCIDREKQFRCGIPSQCIRYDPDCGNYPQNIGYDSEQPCPPEAGLWFDYQFVQLND